MKNLCSKLLKMSAVALLIFALSVPSHAGEHNDFYDNFWNAVSLPHRRVKLSSTIDENVREIYVEEGDYVADGDLLIQLDSREIDAQIDVAEIQADYENRIKSAEEEYELNKREYERSERVGRGISESELDRYETRMRLSLLELEEQRRNHEMARRQLALYESRAKAYRIKSPLSGTVSRIRIDEGEMAVDGQELMEVLDLSSMEFRVHLSESHVPNVWPGQKIEVRFRHFDDFVLEGQVVFVSPYVDSGSGTFMVRARAEAVGDVRPGMACEVRFLDQDAE